MLAGILDAPHKAPDVTPIVFRRLGISGTSSGSIRETQKVLDFSGAHNVVSEVEVIRLDEVEMAFERLLKGDLEYRFVMGMKPGCP